MNDASDCESYESAMARSKQPEFIFGLFEGGADLIDDVSDELSSVVTYVRFGPESIAELGSGADNDVILCDLNNRAARSTGALLHQLLESLDVGLCCFLCMGMSAPPCSPK
jgi:hypothetical protein